MARLLIIGYGSTLRGDDAAGRYAADRLAAIFENKPEVEVLSLPQLTPETALPVADAECVCFIDATGTGKPGTWECQPLVPSGITNAPLGHHYHPAALLAFAGALYGAKPKAWLVTISASSFACGETLSPSIAAAVEEVVAFVAKLASERE